MKEIFDTSLSNLFIFFSFKKRCASKITGVLWRIEVRTIQIIWLIHITLRYLKRMQNQFN